MSIAYPLTSPNVVDGAITVDLMLQEPTRITSYIAEKVNEQLFIDKLFTPENAVGGAIIFDQTVKTDTKVEGTSKIPAGSEFPIVSSTDTEPKVEKVEKTGGKFKVTDEARKRNQGSVIQRESRKLANTITSDIHKGGLEALKSSLTDLGSDKLTVASGGWVAAGKATSGTKTAEKSARADLIRAVAAGAKTELGYAYNLLLTNTDDDAALKIALENDQAVQAFYASFGITPIVTPLLTKGTSYLVAGGAVGTMGVEDPLSAETWDDRKIQSTWFQSWMTVAFGITDPLAIVEITNVDGDA
ncbi:major capsid protein [Corynebacterium callunae]|uniref:major capsid protein n=1 Tax=Corynebacterium callunae TaxID=1721 RepID=UPI003981FEF0